MWQFAALVCVCVYVSKRVRGLREQRQMFDVELLEPHLPILKLAVATGPSVLPSYSGMMVTMYSVSDCSLDRV